MFAHAHQGVVGFAVILLLAACGGPKPQAPEKTKSGPPDTSNVKINGDASDPVNKLVIRAIADLETYWGDRQGAGWARVKAFRQGVVDGAVSCVNYEDK